MLDRKHKAQLDRNIIGIGQSRGQMMRVLVKNKGVNVPCIIPFPLGKGGKITTVGDFGLQHSPDAIVYFIFGFLPLSVHLSDYD